VRYFKNEVDEIIILEPPGSFVGAVGAHYREFAQVDDDTVTQLLAT
jgi:predicted phosphoribosyltransferase